MLTSFDMLGRRDFRDVDARPDAEAPADILGDAGTSGLAISALAELAQRGVQTYDDKQKSDKTQAAASSVLDKSTAADSAWANAEQAAELSGDATMRAQAQTAMQAADTAGAALTGDQPAKRLAAVQAAAKQSAAVTKAQPKDATRAAKAHAWAKILAHLTGDVSASTDGSAKEKEGKSKPGFFTAKHAGLPTYAWIGGGVVLTSGLLFLLLRRRK